MVLNTKENLFFNRPPFQFPVLYLYLFACCVCVRTVLGLSEPESGAAKQGYFPMGGSSECVYKHSAAEGWANEMGLRWTILCLHQPRIL